MRRPTIPPGYIRQAHIVDRQSSVDRAVQRYKLALKQRTGPIRADRNDEEQMDNYRTTLMRTELRITQIRQVLNNLRVPFIYQLAYRNFGLHVDKLVRQYADETLRNLVEAAICRWVCYGLSSEVLRSICERVYGLTL